jgi:ribosome-associated heat shock protein Hsp15
MRIDKWLWAARVFKTRSQATEACKSNKIKIDNKAIKPSHEVKVGEIINVQMDILTKTIKVLGFPPTRQSAKLTIDFIEDLTPESVYLQAKLNIKTRFEKRDKGLGRPTKRERRTIDGLKDYLNKSNY